MPTYTVSLVHWSLLTTVVLVLPVVSQNEQGYWSHDHPTVWSAWSWWSDCSRTCGQGVSRRSRDCLWWTGEKYLHTALTYCSGRSINYRLCSSQDCAQNEDFRAYQCSLNNERHFLLGTSYIWTPVVSENPCHLTCKAKGYRVTQTFGFARDGTPCNDKQTSICVGGKCRAVGCDNNIESGLKFDECQVCGGNGSTCALVRKTVLPVKSRQTDFLGYYYIGQIPQGSTNIEIRETSRNYIALLDAKGSFLLNGKSVAKHSHKADVAGSLLTYSRHYDNQEEVIQITGPTSDAVFLLIKHKGDNQTVDYQYYTTDLRYATPARENRVPEKPVATATQPPGLNSPRRDFSGIDGQALSDINSVKSFRDAESKIEKTRKDKKSDKQRKKEAKEAKLLQKLKAKKEKLEKKKLRSKPAFCKPCQRPRDRNKQFCTSAFVSHVLITNYYRTKNETRYDMRIIKTYKNDIPLLHREYLWVPYKCRCPKLKIGREYVIMGRTSMVKERQSRLTVDYTSYVRNYNDKVDKKLEYFREKKKCQKRKWRAPK